MPRDQGYGLLVMVSQVSAIIKCVVNLWFFFFLIITKRKGDGRVLCEILEKGSG